MTREDIIRMAREAGFKTGKFDYGDGSEAMPFIQSIATSTFLPELERFATLVAAREREVCTAAAMIATEEAITFAVELERGVRLNGRY